VNQLTPILLSLLIAVSLGINGWWAVQWGEISQGVTENRIAIAKIESTRFTEADGAQSLLSVWVAIADLQRQVAVLQED